jgi:hypothetical protein
VDEEDDRLTIFRNFGKGPRQIVGAALVVMMAAVGKGELIGNPGEPESPTVSSGEPDCIVFEDCNAVVT